MTPDPLAIVRDRLRLLIRDVQRTLEEPIRELAAADADDGYNVAHLRDVTTRIEQELRDISRNCRRGER